VEDSIERGIIKVSVIYRFIYNQQQDWAHQQGIKFDKNGYTFSLGDNLFSPLLPEVINRFQSGKGDELGSKEKRGKMLALHSSSALVANVFQYWLNRNISEIASACGASQGMTELYFEQTHRTTLGGIPPHLDLEFRGNKLKPLAIESKFTESYHRHTKRRIKDKYLDARLWTQQPRCWELVNLIREEEKGRTRFSYLDAPQLLKHILGLTKDYRPTGFKLLYLWYEVPSPEAKMHRQQLEEFKRHLGDEVYFSDMTYQELFEIIRTSCGVDENYTAYLIERYFPFLTD